MKILHATFLFLGPALLGCGSTLSRPDEPGTRLAVPADIDLVALAVELADPLPHAPGLNALPPVHGDDPRRVLEVTVEVVRGEALDAGAVVEALQRSLLRHGLFRFESGAGASLGLEVRLGRLPPDLDPRAAKRRNEVPDARFSFEVRCVQRASGRALWRAGTELRRREGTGPLLRVAEEGR